MPTPASTPTAEWVRPPGRPNSPPSDVLLAEADGVLFNKSESATGSRVVVDPRRRDHGRATPSSACGRKAVVPSRCSRSSGRTPSSLDSSLGLLILGLAHRRRSGGPGCRERSRIHRTGGPGTFFRPRPRARSGRPRKAGSGPCPRRPSMGRYRRGRLRSSTSRHLLHRSSAETAQTSQRAGKAQAEACAVKKLGRGTGAPGATRGSNLPGCPIVLLALVYSVFRLLIRKRM